MEFNTFLKRAKPLLVIYVYVFLYIAGYLYFGMRSEQSLSVFTELILLGVGVFAVVTTLLAWRSVPEEQKSIWQWLFVGMVLWVVADFIWAYYDLFTSIELPYPSWADLLWIIGYLPLGLAIIRFLKYTHVSITRKRALFAILGGGIFPTIILFSLLIPSADYFSGGDKLEWLLNALYPALDALLATGGFLCLVAWEYDDWRRPWFYIGAALALWAYSDIWYWLLVFLGIYDLGLLSTLMSDIPYAVAYLVAGLGGLRAFRVGTARVEI